VLTTHALLIFAAVYAAAVATPGPGIVALVTRALAGGFWSAVPNTYGMALGDLILMTLSAFGLALVAQAMGDLFLLVKLAGAGYLIYLGYKFWTAPAEETFTAAPSGAAQGFLSQFALTLGNPKAIGFFVALLPTLIDLKTLTLAGYAELCALPLTVLPAVCLTYAALAHSVRGLFQSALARRRMNKGAGAIMVGAGISVAMT
jgi:threonine/homoserine/homoserine lactone efflux protein